MKKRNDAMMTKRLNAGSNNDKEIERCRADDGAGTQSTTLDN